MLLINPEVVRFGTRVWEDVEALTVDRLGERIALEHDDFGPHAVFADVAEQSARIRIVRRVMRDDVDSPVPGERDTVTFYTSVAGTDAGRRRITATGVVTGVRHDVAGSGARQTITLVALATAGDEDPITVDDAGL